MKAFIVCLVATVAVVSGEPPVSGGYSYSRPGGGGSHGGSIHGGGSDGPLIPVPPGHTTNEGQYVDQQILDEVRKIIFKDEAAACAGGSCQPRNVLQSFSAPSSSYGAPSSSYGPPSSSYGVPSRPHYHYRVVGVDLEGVKQALQVAQYVQQSSGGDSGYSYPSPSHTSYSVPSSSYGTPSSGYGAPF